MSWAKNLPECSPGCQRFYFQTKDPDLVEFWSALDRKMLIYILWPSGIFYGHLGYFMTFGTFWVHLVMVSCTKKNLATPSVAQPIFCPNLYPPTQPI
jgi:hypothetical protein